MACAARTVASSLLLSLMLFLIQAAPCSGMSGLRGAGFLRKTVEREAVTQDSDDLHLQADVVEEEGDEQKGEANEEDDEEDEEEDRDGEDDHDEEDDVDHLERIRRAGGMADTDGDELLSAEEMLRFAERRLDQHRRAVTEEIWVKRHQDEDGKISREDAEAVGLMMPNVPQAERPNYLDRIFKAADADRDGQLNKDEFHAYLHPEASTAVLEVVAEMRFQTADSKPKDGLVTLEEFLAESREGDAGEDFSPEDATADFKVYDSNASGALDLAEFREHLGGHILLKNHVQNAIKAGDKDQDGHIHLEEELPKRARKMLDTEFVEDFFLSSHPHHHEL